MDLIIRRWSGRLVPIWRNVDTIAHLRTGPLPQRRLAVGVLLGLLIGSSRLAYAAVCPLMTAFNALPKAAFVPILVV